MVLEKHYEVMDVRILHNNDRAVMDIWLDARVGEVTLCQGEPGNVTIDRRATRLHLKQRGSKVRRRIVPTAELDLCDCRK